MTDNKPTNESKNAGVVSTNGHPTPASAPGTAPSTTARIARRAAAQSLQERSAWSQGMQRAFQKFLYVAAVVALWCLILGLEIVSAQSAGPITITLSVILFILAIPTGLALRMDDLITWGASYSPIVGLLLATGIVCLNFVIIGAVRGALSGLGQKKK